MASVAVRSPKSLIAGLLFIGIGAAADLIAAGYRMGAALHMGPGYFPFALGLLLMAAGVASVLQGVSIEGPGLGTMALRPAIVITAAVVAFALIVDRFGLVAACAVAVLLASLAMKPWRPIQAVIVAAVLSAAAVGIFIYGLLPKKGENTESRTQEHTQKLSTGRSKVGGSTENSWFIHRYLAFDVATHSKHAWARIFFRERIGMTDRQIEAFPGGQI